MCSPSLTQRYISLTKFKLPSYGIEKPKKDEGVDNMEEAATATHTHRYFSVTQMKGNDTHTPLYYRSF